MTVVAKSSEVFHSSRREQTASTKTAEKTTSSAPSDQGTAAPASTATIPPPTHNSSAHRKKRRRSASPENSSCLFKTHADFKDVEQQRQRRRRRRLQQPPAGPTSLPTPPDSADCSSPIPGLALGANKIAPAPQATATTRPLFSSFHRRGFCPSRIMHSDGDNEVSGLLVASIPANATEFVSKDVAPFLTKHIPAQYAQAPEDDTTKGNTRYCYRHRPDIKCRRQVDESTMDSLQKQLETLSPDDQQAITHVWNLFSAAPATHRKIMLQGILSQCCFPQLSFISNSLRDLIRIDFLSALPPELAFKILSYLDTASLCKAAQVSQRWRMLADDDVVWHKMCEQHIDRKCDKCGWGLPLLERKRLRATRMQIHLRAQGLNGDIAEATQSASHLNIHGKRFGGEDGSPQPETSESSAKRPCQRVGAENVSQGGRSYFSQPKRRPWKDVYSERYKVESNWRRGRCTTRIFKGHTNGIICLQFDDSILATGSYDTTIKIWDIETGEELRTLSGHTLGVRALQFDERMLISGSMDNTLKIWNYRTGECISTLPGHTAGVISLHFDGALLVSGSVDTTIRVWNFKDKSCAVLRGHTDWVNSVKIHTSSKTIFSASDDTTVKLWDLDTKACLRTFRGHVGQVQQVLPILFTGWEDHFKSVGEEKEEGVTTGPSDIASSDATSSFASPALSLPSPPHQAHLYAQSNIHTPTSPSSPPAYQDMPLVISSSSNSQVPHPQRIQDGSLVPKFMLTAGLDCTVKVWNTETGKCIKTLFGHLEGVWALAADTLRVVSGAQDRMVKVWDIKNDKCDRTITGHAAAVTCLALSDSRLVTGSEDCEARMYCFKSGTGVNSDLSPCSGVTRRSTEQVGESPTETGPTSSNVMMDASGNAEMGGV